MSWEISSGRCHSKGIKIINIRIVSLILYFVIGDFYASLFSPFLSLRNQSFGEKKRERGEREKVNAITL